MTQMLHELIHPRDEIMATMERIYRYRMTTTSGGNLSIREPEGNVWITPARIDKGSLVRDDIVCVSPHGEVEGRHKPSSELPFHQAIYDARPDLHGIVHAHPVALVAFSISGQVPNTRIFHQARQVCGEVGFAKYALPGSKKLGLNVAEVFAQGYNCVILENHGVVVGGTSFQEAFQRFETLEFAAKTIIKANMIGDVRYLSDEEIQLPRQRIVDYPSWLPTEMTSHEKELRKQLKDFTRRGYTQRLLISTEGSFSARLDDNSFLMTPYQVDRQTVDLHDFVHVRDGKAEVNKQTSRATRNHQVIYDRHPEINAIVNAYTVNATAFSITGTPLDTRTIPESYLFLRDINRIPYGEQFANSEDFANAVSPERPIALLENDGVLVAGRSVLDAFDRLEVLESTAEAIINSRAIGEVRPMPDEVIQELGDAFGIL